MTLALTLAAAGCPGRSQILPGNISEPGTRSTARSPWQALSGADTAPRPTAVLAAGLSTEERIAWL